MSAGGPGSAAVRSVLESLTREEMYRLVRGARPPEGRAAGYLPGVDRLDLPGLAFVDGPLGVRAGRSTAFPATVGLAAAWDPALAREYGAALGAAAREKGMDAVLAPGVNLVRVPHCGRAFEYLGEDPRLAARLGARAVEGIQSAGALATVKHYVASNQETDRLTVSARVDERTLRECYLPPFEAAVDAGVALVMAAYGRVNGDRIAEHRRLLTDVLKGELGFDGPVVSDWWAVEDGPGAARAGLDVEMPGVPLLEYVAARYGALDGLVRLDRAWPDALDSVSPSTLFGRLGTRLVPGESLPDPGGSAFARRLPAAVEAGEVSSERLAGMVRRVLGLYERLGHLGEGDRPDPDPAHDAAGRRELARRIARRGTVLLENDGVLPLGSPDSLAVVGPDADRAKVGGGGSSEVTPDDAVSPLAGIRRRAPEGADVTFERGLAPVGESSFFRGDGLPNVGGGRGSGGGVGAPGADERVRAARRAAEGADAAVVVVRDDAAEGTDRTDLALPADQDRLVEAVADTAGPTVVVLQVSGPVETPWVDDVEAVLVPWYPGEADGAALADVLFGDADPGGRLPVTFGVDADQYPVDRPDRYPGLTGDAGHRVADYGEGLLVGHRGFDADGLDPAFPFGHGRSYASFEFRGARATAAGRPDPTAGGEAGGSAAATATATVANVGDRPGRTVVQAYVEPPDGGPARPPRELAGFAPLALEPGEERSVELGLADRAFARYDPGGGRWVRDPGEYRVVLGASSRDPRGVATLSVAGD